MKMEFGIQEEKEKSITDFSIPIMYLTISGRKNSVLKICNEIIELYKDRVIY